MCLLIHICPHFECVDAKIVLALIYLYMYTLFHTPFTLASSLRTPGHVGVYVCRGRGQRNNGQSYLVANRQVSISQTPLMSSLISPGSRTQQWHKQSTSTYPMTQTKESHKNHNLYLSLPYSHQMKNTQFDFGVCHGYDLNLAINLNDLVYTY